MTQTTMTQATRRICIDDTDIYLEGSGPETIVMVHGWPDTYRLWDAQVEALRGRYRCVRFTLPGFDTPNARKAYTLDDLTRFLNRVVEQASPDQPVTLLLHDWGCTFGYQFAQRYPHRVSRIIGIDVGDSFEHTARGLSFTLAYQSWLALAWWIGGWVGNLMSRGMMRLMQVPRNPALVTAGMNYPYFQMWFGGKEAYLRQIRPFVPTCPMLFVYGQRKPIMFHNQNWLRQWQQRPGNQVTALPTGHWVMVEQPERLNQVILDWLAE